MHPWPLAPALSRGKAAALAAGSAAGGALVAIVDPNVPGRYPLCPTSALLGLDCPACGGLRGLHAALRGDLLGALDHNLLLAAALPIGAWLWLGWAGAALGRPIRAPAVGRPAVVAVVAVAVAVAVVFSVARNLPIDGLRWLAA